MSVKIGHASIDENGKAANGSAGDQTKKEVCIREWYSKPWNKVLRPANSSIAAAIVKACKDGCNNDNIGYDQSQRTTLYIQAKSKSWDLSKITTKCECDCSSFVAVCVNAAGVAVSKDIYTGNESSALKATGKFTELTDSKYLSSDKYLKAGDILLKENSHTAIVLEDGSLSTSSTGNKSIAEVANEVIAGKWGSGTDRKNRLTSAGYDFNAVQAEVNRKLSGTSSASKSIEEIAREVIAGKWGNGSDRQKKLQAAGYDYSAVQKKVNELL